MIADRFPPHCVFGTLLGLAVTFYFWQIVPWPENSKEGSAPKKAKPSGSSKGKSKKPSKDKEKKKKKEEGEDVDAVRRELTSCQFPCLSCVSEGKTRSLHGRSRPVCTHIHMISAKAG